MSISALDDLTYEDIKPLLERRKLERKLLKKLPYKYRTGAGAYLLGFRLDEDYDFPNPSHPMYSGDYLKGWLMAQKMWPRDSEGYIQLPTPPKQELGA